MKKIYIILLSIIAVSYTHLDVYKRQAIASPMMAGYILYLYKTVRKFWGMAMVVTQELEDIISNPCLLYTSRCV